MKSQDWDDRYEERELMWSTTPNVFLPPIVNQLTPGSALDLACGEGRNAIWLASEGWDATGVDFSPVAIGKAQRIAGDTGVDWIVADVTSYQSTKTFDLVLIVYVHLDTDDMESLMKSATNALAPGGTLIGVGHALRNLADGVGGPPYPDILWTVETLAPLVSGLEIVALEEVLRPVDDSDIDAIDVLLHARKPT